MKLVLKEGFNNEYKQNQSRFYFTLKDLRISIQENGEIWTTDKLGNVERYHFEEIEDKKDLPTNPTLF